MSQNGNFYLDNFFDSNNQTNSTQKEDYVPMSYEEASAQRSTIKTPYSGPDYSYPHFRRIARILRIITAAFVGLFLIITALAYATDGGIFFLEKTIATVNKVEEAAEFYRVGERIEYRTIYNLTMEYEHYNAPATTYVVSHRKMEVGDTDYIYVSKLNSFSVYYLDGSNTILNSVESVLKVSFVLIVLSFIFSNYGRFKFKKDMDLLTRFHQR